VASWLASAGVSSRFPAPRATAAAARDLSIDRRSLLGAAAGRLLAPLSSAAHAGDVASLVAKTVEEPAGPAFRSRPDLLPPAVEVTAGVTASGYVFVTPIATPTARGFSVATQIDEGLGQPGSMILDPAGELVWFAPTSGMTTNLQPQTYRGQPVLVYWEGKPGPGIGYGNGYVLDTSYKLVATVRAGNGLQADLHEFTITAQDTALITAYTPRPADLSSVGGAQDGTVLDSVVQEVDIASGKVLLEWSALDHVPVDETNAGLTAPPFDYFHVNSVSPYNDDELLVSSRNTWTLYRIDRSSGEILARINGKASDYKLGPGATFYWQHHTRQRAAGQISVFDDGASPPEEPRSRGIVLLVDDVNMTVSLVRQFTHPANLLAEFEGSMQPLTGGGAFVGWGDEPYFSEFAEDGSLRFDARLPMNGQSYRAFLSQWVGTPTAPPDLAVERDAFGGTVVYASWNGATQVATWQVRSGSSPSQLSPVGTQPKAGFETAITVRPSGQLIAVAALDSHGKELGVSSTLRL